VRNPDTTPPLRVTPPKLGGEYDVVVFVETHGRASLRVAVKTTNPPLRGAPQEGNLEKVGATFTVAH